ncbi:MAG: hypothetical protein ABJK39_14475 [Hyphomicrobiales bacterium]
MEIKGFLPDPVSQFDKFKATPQSTKQVALDLTKQQLQLILVKQLWWPISQPTAIKAVWLFVGRTMPDVLDCFSDKLDEAKKSNIDYAILLLDKSSPSSSESRSDASDVNVDDCQKVFSTEIDFPEIHWLQLGGKEVFDKESKQITSTLDGKLSAQPCNFWNGDPHGVCEHLEQLIFFKEVLLKRARLSCIVGVSNWKYRGLRPFFEGPNSDVIRAKDYKPLRDCRYIFWGAVPSNFDKSQLLEGSQMLLLEDGFIRSLGLGLLGEAPLSIVGDDDHLYFDARGESRLENILQNTSFDEKLINRAAELRQKIISTRLSKYNLQKKGVEELALIEGQHKILVVGQVENDKSIEFGGAQIKKNKELLKTVRQAYPSAYIAYKPHPDTLTGLRPGLIDDQTIAENCDQYLTNYDIIDAIEWCDTVCTITSLTGFEALMRGKHVVCYGHPFYAGWGLTDDVFPISRRTATRTMDELIAAALILYPQYLHPPTQLPCTPEVLIDWLVEMKQKKPTLWGIVGQKITMIERYVLLSLGSAFDGLRRFAGKISGK